MSVPKDHPVATIILWEMYPNKPRWYCVQLENFSLLKLFEIFKKFCLREF